MIQRVTRTVGGFPPSKGGDNTMTYEFYMAIIATLTLLVAVIALLRK